MSALGPLTDFTAPSDNYKTKFLTSANEVADRTYAMNVWIYADTVFSAWAATASKADKSATENEKEFIS